ncbi:galanin receptor 2b-like isoform X2 [Oculina patagonica]
MEDDFRTSVCIPGAVFVVAFSLMAVVLNGLLLIVLYKDPTKSLRSTTALYIASLAVLHFLFGSVAGPAAAQSYIACALGAEDSPHFQKQFSRICLTFLVRAENFLVLAFSVERLGNTAFPVLHRGEKVKNARICFACIALYSLCFSIFEIVASKWWIRRLDVHLNIIIPLAATVTLSSLLYKATRKLYVLRTEQDSSDCALRAERSHTTKLKKQIPLANAFIFVALLYFVSLMPYFVFALCEVYCSNCEQREWFFASLRSCVAMIFLNAGFNPVIYYICVPEFRRGFKTVFCGVREEQQLRLKPVSRNNNAPGTVAVIYL